jgi:hypothetical protein
VKFYQDSKRTTRKLGTLEEYPTDDDIAPAFQVLQRFMADVNTDGGKRRFVPNSRVTLS